MKYKKECQDLIDEIRNQFNDSQNSTIQHFEHGFINENFGKSHNDPDYNDEADEKYLQEAIYDAQTDLLNDQEAFEEFIWYDEKIRPLIMGLARKICEESHNG